MSFVGWLHQHGFIHPGVEWTATAEEGMWVFRRGISTSKAWPKDRIPGPLVVRPKREAEWATR